MDKRAKLSQRMLADAEGIVSALIDKALEGDTGAESLILSRVLPSLRSQVEEVSFDFDATAPVVRQVEQVLAAIAGGAVAPDVGKQILEAVGALSAIRATEELVARLSGAGGEAMTYASWEPRYRVTTVHPGKLDLFVVTLIDGKRATPCLGHRIRDCGGEGARLPA